MSAPWEVWRDTIGHAWTTPECGDKPITRYLRADLTCGECAKLNDELDPETLRYCADGYLRMDSYPACMKVQPKDRA